MGGANQPVGNERQPQRATKTVDPQAALADAQRELPDDVSTAFGPLQKYLDDPTIEEIWINEPTKVFIARQGTNELTTAVLTPGAAGDVVEKAEVLGSAGPVDAVRRRDAA